MAETGAVWIKQGYVAGERDERGEPVPGAVPPGVYCIDDETFEDFIERLDRKGVLRYAGPSAGCEVHGLTIRVATLAQIAVFESMEARLDGRIQ